MSALPKFVRAITALLFTTAMAQATAQTDFPNKPINQIITSDAMKSFFVKEGATPFAMSPDAFASHLATELERWKVIAQNANIQAE